MVYVRLIPPGAADTVHFRLHVPENAGDKIKLNALNYRKFAWWNTHFAFAGVYDQQQKGLSTPRISTIASRCLPATRPSFPRV